jgi:hypothetical protein
MNPYYVPGGYWLNGVFYYTGYGPFYFPYYPYPAIPALNKCPNCGYCPTCGRADYEKEGK